MGRMAASGWIRSLARTGVSFRVIRCLLHGSLSYKASSIWPTALIRHPTYIESTAEENYQRCNRRLSPWAASLQEKST